LSKRERRRGKAHQGTQALEFSFIPTRDDLFCDITMTSSSSTSSSSAEIEVGLVDFVEIQGRSKLGAERGGEEGEIRSRGVVGRYLAISSERIEGKEGRPRRIG